MTFIPSHCAQGGKGGKSSSNISVWQQLFSQTSTASKEHQPMLLLSHWDAWESGEGRIWVLKGNYWAKQASSVPLLVLWFSDQALISGPTFISTNNPVNTVTEKQSVTCFSASIPRHFIRWRKFIMVCFSNKSYEQAFKKKGILKLTPVGLKWSRILTSVPKPSAVQLWANSLSAEP